MCITGTLSIGRVSHKCENASVAELTKSCEVDDLAVDGGVIDLEVAGVYDNSGRSMDSHTH